MQRSTLFLIGIAGSIASAVAACSAGGTGNLGSGGSDTTATTAVTNSASSGSAGDTITTVGAGGAGGSGSACNTRHDEDNDGDGFSKDQGDCNDCDPNVNPDAVDTPPTVAPGGGMVDGADNNCDGKKLPFVTCDDNLALEDTTPKSAAKAIDLCQETMPGKSWGLIDAKYVNADGSASRQPGPQVGLLAQFGPNVTPRLGKTMLGLSSGHMRAEGQPDFCVELSDNKTPSQDCVTANQGPAPKGFPQRIEPCGLQPEIHDDIALEVKLRAPSNATGYKFNFRFYSFEFAEWVCGPGNDQFVALVSPPPKDAQNGNIVFDSSKHAISVNSAFFDTCDPTTIDNYALKGCMKCVTPPPGIPYCSKSYTDLIGTGMYGGALDGGATSWLETTAPINPRQEFTIRFAIWDTGDGNIDSHVLIDSFKWIATPGVQVGTVPPS